MDKLFQISQLGSAPTQIGLKDLKPIERILIKFSTDLTKQVLANLDKQGINASMALRQSINPLPIELMGKEYSVEIEWADYGKYVDQGVRGSVDESKAIGSPFKYTDKMPPRASIEQWITDKGINPGGSRGDQLEARESLVKQMQVIIFRYGTKRTLFFSDALTEPIQKALIEDVAEALGRTVSISMKL